MKRILFAILILIISTQFVSAQTEYEDLGNGLPTNTTTNAEIISGISTLNSRLTTIENKTDQCLKSSEIDDIIQQIELKSQEETRQALAAQLSLNLIYTAFFFALLFLAKAKRWF